MIRINKFLADCGVASRRGADKLIEDGRVAIDGVVVQNLGVTLDETTAVVTLNGEVVTRVTEMIYLMFYKPKGCVTTCGEEKGRKSTAWGDDKVAKEDIPDKKLKTIFDYIKSENRVYPIGRLDYDSEGLLLLTNDGGLAFKLTHPSSEVGKTYTVRVEGELKESELAVLRNGVMIDGEKTAKCKVKLLEIKEKISKVEMVIYEGKNRQIRKMFEVIGKNVVFLKRVAIGKLKLGGLSRGATRPLNAHEVSYLKTL